MAKKKALGRGIGALIKEQGYEDVNISDEGEREILISKISTNPLQPRKHFDQNEIKSLADSISENGLLQAIVVRKNENKYEIISGERRFRAFKLLKKEKIPARVINAPDDKIGVLALIENLVREDLNPIEVAEGYRRIIEEEGLKQEILAKSVGKSRAEIANMIRLLELPDNVKKLLSEGKLSKAHGRTILALTDDVSRETLAKEIMKEGYSVRKVEEMVREMKGQGEEEINSLANEKNKSSFEKEKKKDPNVIKIERDLTRVFGTKVSVQDKGGSGKIIIEYHNSDDFERIIAIVE